MRLWKRLPALLLALLLLLTGAMPVSAAHVSGTEAVETLETLGLLRGDGVGFAPEREATRAEALVMLLRLLGREEAALAGQYESPYTDAGWAAAYIGYAWKNGLIRGMSETRFGTGDRVGARDYVTLALRALGYRDGDGDFRWADALTFSDKIGLTHGEYSPADFLLREDLALISYTALTLPLADGSMKLIERLYLDGAVTAGALKQTRLAWAVHAGRQSRTAEELYELSASAVFLEKSYESAEDCAADLPAGRASGFFISPDGLALMSAHELDGFPCALVTTLDGRSYPITELLYFDPLQDIALARISRTDTAGNTLRFFPWLPLGDPDALSVGEQVYTVSNPNGLRGCISDGLLSARRQTVDDPAYPMIQYTAPISKGSSGGALLNRFGDVLGVIFGSFVEGHDLNLAVPVNCFDLTGAMQSPGKTLAESVEEQNAKKAAARLWTDGDTELTLTEGESVTVTIFSDWPGQPSIRYTVDDFTVLDCNWGEFLTKQSVELTIDALSAGEMTVIISFISELNDTTMEFHVTVLPADDAEEAPEET